jgi:hypothetical protein
LYGQFIHWVDLLHEKAKQNKSILVRRDNLR